MHSKSTNFLAPCLYQVETKNKKSSLFPLDKGQDAENVWSMSVFVIYM